MRIGYLGGRDDLFTGGVLYTERDVVVECIVKEDGLLVNVTHQSAQRLEGYVAYILSVNGDGAFAHVIETREQVNQGRFTRARLSHQGYCLTSGYGQVDLMENLTVLLVRE